LLLQSRGGPHRLIRSCGRGHIGKSNPPGGATVESPILREGPQRKVQSPGRGHSRKSDPCPCPSPCPCPYPCPFLVPRESILREGPHRRILSCGRGHIVGFRGRGHSRIESSGGGGGRTTGISFELEYLGEFNLYLKQL
jgi:hypothetical protein